MGAVLLTLLYLATAAIPAIAARLARRGRRRCLRAAPSGAAILVLSLLPLAFTASGFLPGRGLTPTPLLSSVAPWADPELVARIEATSQPANPLLLDPVSQMLPWRQAARRGLLFNPSEGGGAALLGNGQSAVLFPTEVAARWLPPFRAATYSQAARLLVAAWGMFLLARALAASEIGALVAAAAFLGSGFLQLWRLHPHSLTAAAAPWIVLAALALARRPGGRSAVALALGCAVGFFGGHPETLLHSLLFAAALAVPFALAAVRRRPRRGIGRGRPLLRRLGWAAAAGVLALLQAAPALLPFLDNLRVSAEWSESRAERRRQIEEPLSGVADRLAPSAALLALGDPRTGTWRGPENLAEVGGGAMGSVALLLAGLAFVPPTQAAGGAGRAGRAGGAGRGRRRLALLLLAIGLLGLAVGAHLPWISTPFGWVPVLRDSLLKRLSLWWALAVPLLAAFGLDRARRSARVRPTVAVAAVALALLLAVVANGAPAAERRRIFAFELAPLLGAALALAAVGRRRGPGTGFGPGGALRAPFAVAVVAGALLLPRVALLGGWVPRASAASFYPDTLATRFVAEQLQAAGGAGYRVAGLDAALVPHAAAFYGFEEIRTYDPMGFAPYRSFLDALGEVPRIGWVQILEPTRPALAFLGVRWVFDHPSMSARPGMEVVYAGRDALVHEVPRVLPRLFVPRTLAVEPDEGTAVAAARRIEDFAELAVVERAPGGGGGGEPLDSAGRLANGAAAVTRLEVEPGRIRATVEAEAPAILASSQPAIPGWRLFFDGAPAGRERLLRANGAFLGVEVSAGRHALELRYAPASWRYGLALGALGLLLAGALLRAGWRRGSAGAVR